MQPDVLMLIALVGAHCFFDFAGQGDFMARAKNPAAPVPGVPWRVVLAAHAAIHGSAVAIITGVWWLWCFEFAAHFLIDETRCRQNISFTTDQALHLVCKFAWFAMAVAST